MEIKRLNPLLKKKAWSRIVHPDFKVPPISNPEDYDIPQYEPDGLKRWYLGNADLIAETCEDARQVNSDIVATRPIWEAQEVSVTVPVMDDNGNPVLNEDGTPKTKVEKQREFVIVGYDEVETVRSGFAECAAKCKTSHFAKNGIAIANEGKEHALFDDFRAWKDISGIDTSFIEVIYSCAKAGDGAIYQWTDGHSIYATVFSPLYGDTVFPQFDDKHAPMTLRRYSLQGQTAVDVFMDDYIETYTRADLTDSEYNGVSTWWRRVKGWFRNHDYKETEDGWKRISRTESQGPKGICQCTYFRFNDTVIGPAIQNLNAWERGASYVSDKVKSMAFSKLLLKATKIESLPNLSSGEEVIGIKGTADELKASSAEYLTPPNMSDIATIDLKNKREAILESTLSVDIQPEILKSGADSSTTIKILFRREIQWCHVMWPQVRQSAQQLIEVLKWLAQKIDGGEGRDYTKLKVSVWNDPWIPMNDAELISNAEKLVYAGILSKENARHELNLQYTDDVELVRKEAEEELYRKTFIPKKAEADAIKEYGLGNTADDVVVDKVEDGENPEEKENKPKVNNQAARKDIAE